MVFQWRCLMFFCAVIFSVEGTSNCDVGAHFYQELGCKEVKYNGNPCKIYYDCPEYTRIPEHCRYQGNQYKIDELIKNAPRCNPAAVCMGDNDNKTLINYAEGDCLAPQQIKSKFCYKGYSNLNECCRTTFCADSREAAVTCQVNGKKIYEGQMYTTKNTCNDCLCKKDFDQTPFCQKTICGTEIHFTNEVEKNCAPIYSKKSMCCPSSFLCDDDCKDLDIIVSKYKGKEYVPPCRFGNRWIPINGRFNTTINSNGFQNIMCSCDVPPFVTCRVA